jgi:hypothetical protein
VLGPKDSQHPLRNWVFAAFLLVAAFFLLTEHRAHLYGALPYLLLLACPLMHFFGHGHHGHGKDKSAAPSEDQPH